MDVLKPLRVFLERGSNGEHFEQVKHLESNTSRNLCYTFVTPGLGRYTVPALCGYGDVALWVANDVQFTFGDVSHLWRMVRKQETCCVYVPKEEFAYARPSMMLFRNKYCERLTPDYIFRATPDDLIPSVWSGGSKNVGILEV